MVKILILWTHFVASVILAIDECNVAIVSRRTVDVLKSNATNCQHYACNKGNSTYLVTEQQCVSNSTFFHECPFAIAPTGEPHELRLTVYTVKRNFRIQTFNSTDKATNAIVINIKSKEKQVNSSVCSISSLEVYRGREKAFEINHTGFLLDNSGTIETHEDPFEHNFTEYTGELYRMNLSCNNSELPTHGCLFFKVAGDATITEGTSYKPSPVQHYIIACQNDNGIAWYEFPIYPAKFNGTVPRTANFTISDSEIAQNLITTTDIIDKSTTETTAITPQSSSPNMPTTSTTLKESEASTTKIRWLTLEIGSPLFYGLVGAGSVIILILLLCVIGVSILACRRGYNTSHTEKEGQPIYEDLDNRNGQMPAITNPGYNNNLNTMNGHNDNSVGIAEQDFTSHTYQEIGATYQEIMPMVKDSNQRQVQWGIINPILLQPDSSEESQEYSTLNHMLGGQLKVLNNSHCNGESTIDSEQYAKLNSMDNQLV